MLKKEKKKISLINILITIILFFIFFAIIFSLIIANIRIRQRRAEIMIKTEAIEKEILAIKELTDNLENDIRGIGEDDYLEKIAREKLGLRLEGEEVVFITREKKDDEEFLKEIDKKEESIGSKIKSFFNFLKY